MYIVSKNFNTIPFAERFTKGYSSIRNYNNQGSEKSWVAQLDGVAQFWQLSAPIAVSDGYVVEIEFSNKVVNTNSYLICSQDSVDFGVFTSSNTGYILSATGTPMLIDVDNTGGGDVVTFNGQDHHLKLSILSNGLFSKIGARFNDTRILNGWLSNLRVFDALGTLVNEIPLTNKSQGATQLPIVGTVSATMVNYTEAVWREEGSL